MTDTVSNNVLYVNSLYMITAAAHLPRHAAWFLCLKVDNMNQNCLYQSCHADESQQLQLLMVTTSSGTNDWQISETPPTPEAFVSSVMQLSSSLFFDVARHS